MNTPWPANSWNWSREARLLFGRDSAWAVYKRSIGGQTRLWIDRLKLTSEEPVISFERAGPVEVPLAAVGYDSSGFELGADYVPQADRIFIITQCMRGAQTRLVLLVADPDALDDPFCLSFHISRS
ncbi:MAG: hypothetical protein ACT4O1_06765 [Gemmatimonadota bacterium]